MGPVQQGAARLKRDRDDSTAVITWGVPAQIQWQQRTTARAKQHVLSGGGVWVHEHCARASSEVAEEDGTWSNLWSAVDRGRHTLCSDCKQKGATVGCCHAGCSCSFHLGCAVKSGWAFDGVDSNFTEGLSVGLRGSGKRFYCLKHCSFCKAR